MNMYTVINSDPIHVIIFGAPINATHSRSWIQYTNDQNLNANTTSNPID